MHIRFYLNDDFPSFIDLLTLIGIKWPSTICVESNGVLALLVCLLFLLISLLWVRFLDRPLLHELWMNCSSIDITLLSPETWYFLCLPLESTLWLEISLTVCSCSWLLFNFIIDLIESWSNKTEWASILGWDLLSLLNSSRSNSCILLTLTLEFPLWFLVFELLNLKIALPLLSTSLSILFVFLGESILKV